MKKILFINIFAFILGVIGLSAQCTTDVSIYESTTETCTGSSDGTATALGTGPNGVTYLWSNGQTTATATGLTAGTYTLTVTDGTGCTASESIEIIVDPEGVWIMNTSTPVSCNGGSDGTAYAGVMTGQAPYTYIWNDPAGTTNSSPVGLAAGTYTVTVTDANGCSNAAPVTVEEPTAIVVISNSTDEVCFGDGNGSASVTTSGGTGQMTFSWSNGASSSSNNNLTAGTYTVTVTDANACTSVASITVNLTNPQINISGSSVTVTCFGGNDGSATANVTSGNGPFTYSWSNGVTGATASGLSAGTYDVTVTGANGCSATTSITVSEPTQLTITVDNSNTTNVTCNGGNNGSIGLTTTGGTGTITYMWSNGATTQTISNLSAGTYTVTATDANGCTVTTTHTITEPAVLTATGTGTDVTTVGGTDGTATVTHVGGTGPYTYLWSNGATTQTISNLPAGTYTVTVTDANGCTTTTTVTIGEPIATINLTINSTPSTCGANDGTATVMASGGFTPYTYLWSDGQTTSTATGLAGGTYTVTVTDNVGNTATTSVTVMETSGVTATASSSNETCSGSGDGHVSVSTSGGVGQMSFLWSNGATTSTVNGLSVGTYTVTVTDQNGCTATASATIELSPEGIWVDITTTHVTCFGGNDGAAASVVTTGVSPYTYAWNNGGNTPTISNLTVGTYTVTVTDVNGCEGVFTTEVTQPTQLTATISSTNIDCGQDNGSASVMVNGGTPGYTYMWSNGATTQDISGVSAGTYTVTATDANGCTVVSSTMIIDNNTLAVGPVNTSDPTTAGGTDGSIDIEVSGGTAPYTYMWSNGATTQDISGLSAGCYTVTVTDAVSCSIISTHCINDPGMLTVVVTTTDNGCMGNNMGTATATPTDGTPPYTYMWSTQTGFPLGTTQTITGLTNGTYLVTVTDANGIQGTGTGVVTGSGGVNSSATVVNITCNGANDGSAIANGIGGAPGLNGYQYNWSNGETTQNISNLAPGDYTVTVTDLEGCTSTSTVTVTEPSSLTVSSAIGTNPTTAGGSDGAINLTVMGGTPGYTFLWSNGATTEDISGLTAGCYTVTITDSNNCTATSETCLMDPSPCSLTVTSTPESCDPAMDGTVTATPSAGCTSPFDFSWVDANGNPIGNTATVGGLSAGFYTVTFTDANGNVITQTVEVIGGNTVMSNATATNVSCNGGSDGSATGNGSGGSGIFTYSWSNGQNTQTISNLTAGTYTVTVTDQNGCTSVSSVMVTEPSAIITTGTTGTPPSSAGANDGSIDLVVSGGTPGYTFLWSNGETTEDISGLSAGCYTVTITDSNNCTATSETCIDPPSPCVIIVSSTPESCVPGMDGTVTVSISGCALPVTFEWVDANGIVIGISATVTGLIAGDYTVTVTEDNGNMTSQTVEVMGGNIIMSNATGMDVSCNGGNDGSATATGSGGNGPYTFEWSNGSMTQDISNLPAGTYTVTVTDDDGCTSISSVTIDEPTQIITTGTVGTNPTVAGGSDGSIDLMVSGGTAPYTFLWSNGETTEDISGLTAGCYTVTITDANNCTATSETCLEDPPLFAISASSIDDPCTIGDNGVIDSEVVSGGVQPINFVWLDSNGDTVGMTAMVPDVPAGEYTVIATDDIGQTDSKTVTVVTEPGPSLSAPDDMTTCDEKVSLGVTADAAATIKWYSDLTPPATEIVTIDPDSLLDYGLSSGENMIFVEAELNGCVTLDTVIVNQESMDVSVQAASAFCLGSDGQLMATNNDPQDIVTYQWTPASAFISGDDTATPTLNTSLIGITEVYLATENQHGCLQFDTISVAVQDTALNFIETSNCNPLEVNFANNGATEYVWDFGDNSPLGSGATPVHNYATAGTYTVMMILPAGTPNAGCLPDTVTKVIEVADDPIFDVNFAIDYEPCSEDSVMVVFTDNSTNATLDITGWSWGLPGSTTSINQQDSILIGESGTYTASIVVTAEDGCKDSLTQMFDVSILDINLLANDTLCFGEETQLNPFGNPDYTYDWSNGIGTVLNPTITGDQSTDYMVTITDPNIAGCEVERSVSIFVPEVMDDLATSPDTILCIDGSVILDASSAFATDYIWSAPLGNQVGTGASFEIQNIGEPQYYYVEAFDQYGCSTLDSVFAGNAQIVSLLMGDGDLCLGDETTITTMITSAGDSLFYEWTDANGNIIGLDDSLNLSPTVSSNYNVNVSNEFGCDFNSDFSLNVVDIATLVSATAEPDTIFEGEITTLGVNHPGDEYSYQWNNEGTFPDGPSASETRNPEAMPTVTTPYQVVVTNTANSCSTIANVLVTVVTECDEPFIFIPNAFSPNDDSYNDRLLVRSVVIDDLYFVIYNRWGEKVYETEDIGHQGWDGTHNGEKVCSDVYGYYLRARCINGKDYVKKGNITVLK